MSKQPPANGTRSNPRPVSIAELWFIRDAYCEEYGITREEYLEPELAAYWPDFISDGPGYAGPLIVAVWPGGPDLVTTFTQSGSDRWKVETSTG